jgi:sacsin
MALEAWRQEKVKMIPWVGVAAQLAAHACAVASSSSGRSLSCMSSTGGRAFCFLPLPASTRLPVHINGYFELSSNR